MSEWRRCRSGVGSESESFGVGAASARPVLWRVGVGVGVGVESRRVESASAPSVLSRCRVGVLPIATSRRELDTRWEECHVGVDVTVRATVPSRDDLRHGRNLDDRAIRVIAYDPRAGRPASAPRCPCRPRRAGDVELMCIRPTPAKRRSGSRSRVVVGVQPPVVSEDRTGDCSARRATASTCHRWRSPPRQSVRSAAPQSV